MIFKEYTDFITSIEHADVLTDCIYQSKWRFGQVSDNTIEPNYPMWFQNYYDIKTMDFVDTCPGIAKTITERFQDLLPDDYLLVRSMASANTFGLDGDFHTDWPHPDVSITGVLYTDKTWERNWGGETLFAHLDIDGDKLYAS